jgi:hypothetical protein
MRMSSSYVGSVNRKSQSRPVQAQSETYLKSNCRKRTGSVCGSSSRVPACQGKDLKFNINTAKKGVGCRIGGGNKAIINKRDKLVIFKTNYPIGGMNMIC